MLSEMHHGCLSPTPMGGRIQGKPWCLHDDRGRGMRKIGSEGGGLVPSVSAVLWDRHPLCWSQFLFSPSLGTGGWHGQLVEMGGAARKGGHRQRCLPATGASCF